MEPVGRVWMVIPNAVHQDLIERSRSRLPMAWSSRLSRHSDLDPKLRLSKAPEFRFTMPSSIRTLASYGREIAQLILTRSYVRHNETNTPPRFR